MGPNRQPKRQAPTISSIDKSLGRNCHRVGSPPHRRAIKEESKVANLAWVDHQACSMLQYINVTVINCAKKLLEPTIYTPSHNRVKVPKVDIFVDNSRSEQITTFTERSIHFLESFTWPFSCQFFITIM